MSKKNTLDYKNNNFCPGRGAKRPGGDMADNVLYEHLYYLMRQTKQPKYLDFYELEGKDLKKLEYYVNQTIRYNGEWYFVKMEKTYFYDEFRRDAAPMYYIKKLWKQPEPIN